MAALRAVLFTLLLQVRTFIAIDHVQTAESAFEKATADEMKPVLFENASFIARANPRLMCYQCRSDAHEGCNDVRAGTGGNEWLRPCRFKPPADRPVCRLIVQAVQVSPGAPPLKVRECGREAASDDGGCYINEFGTQNVCECFRSACNSARRCREITVHWKWIVTASLIMWLQSTTHFTAVHNENRPWAS